MSSKTYFGQPDFYHPFQAELDRENEKERQRLEDDRLNPIVTMDHPTAGEQLLAAMQGYLVGLSGRTLVPNPYPGSGFKWQNWDNGFRQGTTHRLRELDARPTTP